MHCAAKGCALSPPVWNSITLGCQPMYFSRFYLLWRPSIYGREHRTMLSFGDVGGSFTSSKRRTFNFSSCECAFIGFSNKAVRETGRDAAYNSRKVQWLITNMKQTMMSCYHHLLYRQKHALQEIKQAEIWQPDDRCSLLSIGAPVFDGFHNILQSKDLPKKSILVTKWMGIT